MAVFSDIFDLWATNDPIKGSIYLRVRNYIRPTSAPEGIICLTVDAIDADEFDLYVDEVIEQLQAIKKRGRRRFAALRRQGLKSAA